MIRKYTVMESNIGETQNKINQAITVANEVPSLVLHKDNADIHVTSGQKASWNGAVADIGTKSGLLTTNKTNLVSAVNELFTNANNGKTAVSSAITAKGVSASPTDTFAVLADKIGLINTGKKFAEGELSTTLSSITVNNLSFRPSIVLIKQADETGSYTNSWRYAFAVYYGVLGLNNGGYNHTGSNWGFDPEFTINNTGFRSNMINPGGARDHKWIAIE